MNLSTTRVRFRALTQVVLATMLVLISISGLKAQTTKGGLVGMVVDATGAVVPVLRPPSSTRGRACPAINKQEAR